MACRTLVCSSRTVLKSKEIARGLVPERLVRHLGARDANDGELPLRQPGSGQVVERRYELALREIAGPARRSPSRMGRLRVRLRVRGLEHVNSSLRHGLASGLYTDVSDA